MNGSVVIVGASIAGVSAAEALRRHGFTGSVTLVGDEPHLPYDRPLLSKDALTDGFDSARLGLRPADHFDDMGINLELGVPASRFDGSAHLIELQDGREISGDYIVLATGAHPRISDGMEGADVFTLRSVDDARRLRQAFQSAGSLTVVGGGFVGCEVAASARALGIDVTIVEAATLPMSNFVGCDVARAVVEMHARRGVRVLSGRAVRDIRSSSSGVQVGLSDDSAVYSDIAVVGLGSGANTRWLDDSGIQVDDGVLCNEVGMTSVNGVFAAGDVASWVDRDGRYSRCQHWTLARQQGETVARIVCGSSTERREVPDYFWSDQYGRRLQCYGSPLAADRAEILWGAYEDERFLTALKAGDQVVALVGMRAAQEIRKRLQMLDLDARRSSALAV